MKDKNLEPCPFCGSEAEIVELKTWEGSFYVHCPNCGIEQGYRYPYEEAVEQWNMREGVRNEDKKDNNN